MSRREVKGQTDLRQVVTRGQATGEWVNGAGLEARRVMRRWPPRVQTKGR